MILLADGHFEFDVWCELRIATIVTKLNVGRCGCSQKCRDQLGFTIVTKKMHREPGMPVLVYL